MTDDVGVNMLAEVEANRKAASGGPCGSLSATVGIPASFENRTVGPEWNSGADVAPASAKRPPRTA
jgi:hypothetical protein